MGEANRRGTFEERKETAINLKRIKDAELRAKNVKSTLKTDPPKRVEIRSGNRRDQYKSMRFFAMLTAMGYGFGQSECPVESANEEYYACASDF